MTPGDRKRMLDALGLVDWRPRPDRFPASTANSGDEPVAAAVVATAAHEADDRTQAQPAITADEERAAARTQPPADWRQAATPSEPVNEPEAQAPPHPREQSAEAVAEPAAQPSAHDPSRGVSQMGWDELEAWLASRDHRGASRPVFGIGARDADVLIVGEAPGANEDAQGVPFVGRAGKLLDRMLAAIGCSRDTNVYITNICKFRPPNNRDPNADEVAADWPVLERQIELMEPKLVVAVGRVAAQTLLDSKQSLGKLRGTLHRYPRRELDVLVTYHPAFLLRSPGQKAKAWVDLKQIARRIGDG